MLNIKQENELKEWAKKHIEFLRNHNPVHALYALESMEETSAYDI